MSLRLAAATTLALLTLTPALASAQIEINARAATITFGGRLQTQYSVSSIDGADNDFFTRRARMIAEVRVNDFLSGRVQPDFAGGTIALKDAYFEMTFSEVFALTIGQFKRPFDLFGLASSTELAMIERDGRIEGLSTCTGVGSICSHSRFTESLGYSDRDMGVRVSGASGQLSYQAALTNGTGGDNLDENDAKSVSGRVTYDVNEDVRVSGQIALHDYVDAAGNATGVALGGDVEVGTYRDGLLVQASLISGDNWRALDAQLDPATFITFQGLAAYYAPLSGGRFAAFEPMLRVSYGDPDTGTDDDSGILITPGVSLYIMGRNKIGVNLDYYSPQSGSEEFSLKIQSFLYF